MNLAKLALDHSRITIIAMLMIVALGLSTYLTYPSAEDPTIKIRSASVTASFPGMSAERIEDLIRSGEHLPDPGELPGYGALGAQTGRH